MDIIIDFQPYSRPPRFDALRGVALGIQLVRAAPPSPTRAVARSLRQVRADVVALQEELKLRGRVRPERIRPIDIGFDNGWTAARDRVVSWTKVHSATFEALRRRAEQLIAMYFSDGVEFVKLSSEAQWVYSQNLLDRIEEEGARADLERLAGPEFFANVREQHAALGAALGLSGRPVEKEVASTTGLAERVDALAKSIADYTRRLAGEVDTDDPASVAAFRKAVAPLDAHRAAFSARRSSAKPSEPAVEPELVIDPSEPIPAGPDEV